MRRTMRCLVLLAAVCSFTVCVRSEPRETYATSKEAYLATLRSMNSKVTGREATGETRFDVMDQILAIRVSVRGFPADLEHWQHLHGFKENRKATCPTDAADVNHDGIIDITEAEPVSGMTMVPFNRDPATMQVMSDTYPQSAVDGVLLYRTHSTADNLAGRIRQSVRRSEPRSRPARRVYPRCGAGVETAGVGGVAGNDSGVGHVADRLWCG